MNSLSTSMFGGLPREFSIHTSAQQQEYHLDGREFWLPDLAKCKTGKQYAPFIATELLRATA